MRSMLTISLIVICLSVIMGGVKKANLAPPAISRSLKIIRFLNQYQSDHPTVVKISKAVILQTDKFQNISDSLVVSIIAKESSARPLAKGASGEIGLMQIHPSNENRFPSCGENLWDILTNICYGVRILNSNMEKANDLTAALRGYNGCTVGPCLTSYPNAIYSLMRKFNSP